MDGISVVVQLSPLALALLLSLVCVCWPRKHKVKQQNRPDPLSEPVSQPDPTPLQQTQAVVTARPKKPLFGQAILSLYGFPKPRVLASKIKLFKQGELDLAGVLADLSLHQREALSNALQSMALDPLKALNEC